MIINRIQFTVALLVTGLVLPSAALAASKRYSRVSKPAVCRSVIFSDVTKGKILFAKNITLKVLPASTAKIMTALVVLETLPLDQYVTVGPHAKNIQPSTVNLVPGEKYKVRDLLYALLLNSANDASIVLAEAVAGSEVQFVQKMNRRARQLGAKNTRFANSNGLPTARGTQFSTAQDMSLIFREALKNSFFRIAIRYRYKIIHSNAGRQIVLKSHNKILFNDWNQKVYGKTGYTRAAQSCFVGSLEQRGRTMIIAVFGCSDRWKTIKSVVTRYGKVRL